MKDNVLEQNTSEDSTNSSQNQYEEETHESIHKGDSLDSIDGHDDSTDDTTTTNHDSLDNNIIDSSNHNDLNNVDTADDSVDNDDSDDDSIDHNNSDVFADDNDGSDDNDDADDSNDSGIDADDDSDGSNDLDDADDDNDDNDDSDDDAEDNSRPRESVAYLAQDKAERLSAFLKYSEISDVQVEYDEISDTYDVNVLSKDFERAQNLYDVFAANELSDADDYDDSDEINSADSDSPASKASNAQKKVEVNLYESSTEKYKDNLSSAITFFICGAAGLVILLLNDFGVLHFLTKESSSFILMNIVLGLLFAGFIVIGFLSLKYSKKAKERAQKETEALNHVKDWLKENISKEAIEASYDNTIPDEMKYFSRSEYVKNAIKDEFTDLDEATIDFINDQYLEELF